VVASVVAIMACMADMNAYALGVEIRDSQGNLIGAGGKTTGSNPFELGAWFYPILVTNVVLAAIIAARRTLFSSVVLDFARSVMQFEISSKLTFVLLSAIILTFTFLVVDDLSREETRADYSLIEHDTKDWNWTRMGLVGDQYMRVVKFFFISLSFQVFGNPRIIPYIASMALLVMIYFFTKEMTKKRISGVVAAAITVSSNIFILYSVSATYDQIYLLFYVLSLYLAVKKWHLSLASYILSLFAKPITAAFLPITFFFIYQYECERNTKKRLALAYGALSIAGVVAIATLGFISGGFYQEKVGDSLRQLPILLRLDGPVIFMFVLPLILGLYLKARSGIQYAEFLMFSLLLLLSFPILYLMFSGSVNEHHNMVPLVAFFAISVGMLLSNNKQQLPKNPIITKAVFVLAMGVATVAVISGLFPQLTLVP